MRLCQFDRSARPQPIAGDACEIAHRRRHPAGACSPSAVEIPAPLGDRTRKSPIGRILASALLAGEAHGEEPPMGYIVTPVEAGLFSSLTSAGRRRAGGRG